MFSGYKYHTPENRVSFWRLSKTIGKKYFLTFTGTGRRLVLNVTYSCYMSDLRPQHSEVLSWFWEPNLGHARDKSNCTATSLKMTTSWPFPDLSRKVQVKLILFKELTWFFLAAGMKHDGEVAALTDNFQRKSCHLLAFVCIHILLFIFVDNGQAAVLQENFLTPFSFLGLVSQ